MIIVNKFGGGTALSKKAERRASVGNCLSSARLPKGGQRRKYESTLIDYIGGDSYGK